jgi:toxin ParE1/3/4
VTGWSLRPDARADLDDIWEFTADRWGLDQAESYLSAFENAFDRAASAPGKGRSIHSSSATFYRVKSGSHFVFYEVANNQIIIVRVLHQAMDVDRHLPLPTST